MSRVVVVATRLNDALGYAYRLPGRVTAMSAYRANRGGLRGLGLGSGDTVHVLPGTQLNPDLFGPLRASGCQIKAVRR